MKGKAELVAEMSDEELIAEARAFEDWPSTRLKAEPLLKELAYRLAAALAYIAGVSQRREREKKR